MAHRRCESRPGTVGRAVMGVEEGFGGPGEALGCCPVDTGDA